jgi:hypothetical protein
MPRRTLYFQQLPWTGGLNTAVDSGAIPPNDLTIADNIIFSTSGARVKRQGLSYFDAASAIPASLSRSSVGTTRTIVFASAISVVGNQRLVVGEKITVSGGPSAYNGNFTVASITTTNVANDTITYVAGSVLAQGNTADAAIIVSYTSSIIALHDYWRTDASNNKVQLRIAVTDQPKIFSYDSTGMRTEVVNTGTALTGPETTCSTAVMNEKLIFGFGKIGNTPKKYNPDLSANLQDLGGTPPDFSICQVHQSKLFANNKLNKDELNASSTGDPEEWTGNGDSWVVEIDPGDGDSEGIVQIHPPFKGDLFQVKGRKTYRLVGNDASNYQILPVTNGLGGVGVRSVAAVDLDDVVYCSPKGFHSLAATSDHGDFKGAFLSAKIQPTFNAFNQPRLKYTQSAYVPDLNSIAFAVSGPSASGNDQIYFYNINIKEWYRWPSISCQAIACHISSDGLTKLLIGTNQGRILESQNGTYSDFGTTGIDYDIVTGSIYPDSNPNTMKGFKMLTLLFRPLGDFSFTATIKIDNHAPQALVFSASSGSDLLGSTFVLGTSVLGSNDVMAPFSYPIDGYGRGFVLEIEQNSPAEQVELYGLIIEYEPADLDQEVLGTSGG